jgi:hypothetical protein
MKPPILMLCGRDEFHPTPVSEEIARLAPDAGIIMKWKTPDVLDDAVRRVREFLRAHHPA